jgi:hypothetical protein
MLQVGRGQARRRRQFFPVGTDGGCSAIALEIGMFRINQNRDVRFSRASNDRLADFFA